MDRLVVVCDSDSNQAVEVVLNEHRSIEQDAGRMCITPAERRRRVLDAVGRLGAAENVDGLIEILRSCARSLAQADGITVVARVGDEVLYVAEDAMAPLWTGQRFRMENCISGLAMLQDETIHIADITLDHRIPLFAYASTFVRSMAMYPIGCGRPMWALGAYWSAAGPIDADADILLRDLTRSAAFALGRLAIN